MRLHILGICGTFMGGLAVLAKEAGHEVTGSDINSYPPMNLQLQSHGISIKEGYLKEHLETNVDCVLVGNVIKRGNPAIEYILNEKIPYTSGPAWLYDNILKERTVIGVAGTHGKTTTTSLISWLMESAGLKPGFLVGGVPQNFAVSARLGNPPFFVIEADEYDSAFFDKRAKFIHYHPKTLVLNNLEYDHADIFPDLNAIKQQFIYLLRTIPGNGQIISNANDKNLVEIVADKDKNCFSTLISFGGEQGLWRAVLKSADGRNFSVFRQNQHLGEVSWPLLGNHNVENALAAIASVCANGMDGEAALKALGTFKSVKRRLEIKAKINDITIYDDFAHHPTAIASTLAGLRANIGREARLIAVLEFGSYTMRHGVHKDQMKQALKQADVVMCKTTEEDWGLAELLNSFDNSAMAYAEVAHIVEHLQKNLMPGDHVIFMSNSSFYGIHQKLICALKKGEHSHATTTSS